jgi:hypothetical protein
LAHFAHCFLPKRYVDYTASTTHPPECGRRTAVAAMGAIWLLGMAVAALGTEAVPRIAFFGFDLANTSAESTRPEELQRLRMLGELFVKMVNDSGRFRTMVIPADLQNEIAAGPEISNCNGCERLYAKRIGADWAAWGSVQKVSNLILNINLYIEDAQTNKLEFVKSVDIRGNTDESWRRGLTYMLQHYLLGAEQTPSRQ